MVWQLTAPQCFFIAIIVFGVIGFQRGWKREVITLAFTLTGILFLMFGSLALAQLVYVNVPRATQALFNGGVEPAGSTTPIYSSDPRVAISTGVAFIAFIALGYFVSAKAMPRPANPAERVWGIIPAVITGYAILTFITTAFGRAALFTVNVNTPNQNLIGSYLLIIFVVIIVAVIVALITASAKKSPPAKKP